ncbi:MAG: hypothetical protein RIG84_09300, partial [Roseovarius sp.]
EMVMPVLEAIEAMGIRKIVFQGFSRNADLLLLAIKARFLEEVECFAVTHVTTTQFEHFFEIEQIRALQMRLSRGVLKGLGSVKADFGAAFEEFYPHTLINYAPNIDPGLHLEKDSPVSIHVPLDVSWRKNMYTNVTAGMLCESVERIKTSNYPTGLSDIRVLDKLMLTGYLRGQRLLDEMSRSTAVISATLAECQPMTQLEAFAMNTPALTLDLGLVEFEGDPLMELCSTRVTDNPYRLSKDIGRLVDAALSDPAAMSGMIRDHLDTRTRLATERLKDFVGI